MRLRNGPNVLIGGAKLGMDRAARETEAALDPRRDRRAGESLAPRRRQADTITADVGEAVKGATCC